MSAITTGAMSDEMDEMGDRLAARRSTALIYTLPPNRNPS
jgi:hypothetical protein